MTCYISSEVHFGIVNILCWLCSTWLTLKNVKQRSIIKRVTYVFVEAKLENLYCLDNCLIDWFINTNIACTIKTILQTVPTVFTLWRKKLEKWFTLRHTHTRTCVVWLKNKTWLSVLLNILVSCVVFLSLFVFILCLVCSMLSISLDWPFVTDPSVFSNVDNILFWRYTNI